MPIAEPRSEIVLNQRYILLEELGRGGAGVVFKASDPVLNRQVAIKLLTSSTLNPQLNRRLRHEAQAVAGFNHPNIVAVYDFGEHDGTPYIVMELVEGESLAAHMPIQFDRALTIVYQMCLALEHAHRRGVTHRDLKPENVLLSISDGNAKLVDFGIAQIHSSRLTADGVIIGTLGYMSPEQIRGEPIDSRADLYSVGVMLYELVTQSHPFSTSNAFQLLNHHLYTSVTPPIELAPGIPPELNSLIVKLLEKDPNNRPASFGEVIPDLRRMCDDELDSVSDDFKIHGLPDERRGKTTPSNLRSLKTGETDFLDAIQLTLIHQYPDEVRFDPDDLILLFGSVLRAGSDLNRWLGRARSETDALYALMDLYRKHPSAEQRAQLVEVISKIDDETAADALVMIATVEENHFVRTRAAVLSATRGRTEEIVNVLRSDIENANDPTALAAYVAIADEVGTPKIRLGFQNVSFFILLAQRRWAANKSEIKSVAWRGALGAGLFAIPAGLARPLIVAWMNPELFLGSVENFGMPTWPILGAAVLLVIGMAQGFITTLFVGVSDLISASRSTRYTAGALSGIVHSLYLILFTKLGLFPQLPAQGGAYIPNYLISGFLFGLLLTRAIPKNLESPPRATHMKSTAVTALLLAVLTAGLTYAVYAETFMEEIIKRILFNSLSTLGLGYAMSIPQSQSD